MAEPETREPELREPELRQPKTREPDLSGPDTREPDTREPDTRQRILVRAGIAAAAATLLFGIAVIALNLTVFSPSGFVTTYLETLGERDVADALAMPGVDLPGSMTKDSAAAALLKPESLASITDITTTNDVDLGNGVHRITARYLLSGAQSESRRASSQFLVRDAGASYLFFNQWSFATSPVASLQVRVANGASATAGTSLLTANDLGADVEAFSAVADFPVLVPGLVVLSHESAYLTGIVAPVLVDTPGQNLTATVAAAPNTAFIAAVTTGIRSFLDACATSTSLFPPGCPFSRQVSDRIVGSPAWSITAYPPIGILSGAESWILAQSSGTAQIRVDVRSLFDGSVTTLDESVPFRVDYRIMLASDGTITFGAR